jgi:dTDP-4-dehydrorhamnose reductase
VKILLTGRNGQLGSELSRSLAPLGELVAFDRAGLDLSVADQIASAVRSVRPDVIVNAAAYTAVDRAESEPELAHAVNATGVAALADEAKRARALLVHFSTDYVFDGTKDAPYVEEDEPHPLSAYGRSKLDGENAIRASDSAHLILRTSWVYSTHGKNFLLTIRRLLREKNALRVVADQIGAPTFAGALADATAEVLRRHDLAALGKLSGVYHATAGGSTSWYGFATQIARLEGPALPRMPRIVPIPSSEYPLPAARPRNSRLSGEKLFGRLGVRLPSWEQCLESCYARLSEGGEARDFRR